MTPTRSTPQSTQQFTSQFTLYSRSYCHLCDDMLAGLQAMAGAQPFAVDVIDIDADPALVERFDELVPVLFGADLAAPELCHYFLDHDAVRAHLAQHPGAGAESSVELTPANRSTG